MPDEGVTLVDPTDLAGVAEVARHMGVRRQAVCNWPVRYPREFPKPVVILASGPVYLLSEVLAWRTRHRTGDLPQ